MIFFFNFSCNFKANNVSVYSTPLNFVTMKENKKYGNNCDSIKKKLHHDLKNI